MILSWWVICGWVKCLLFFLFCSSLFYFQSIKQTKHRNKTKLIHWISHQNHKKQLDLSFICSYLQYVQGCCRSVYVVLLFSLFRLTCKINLLAFCGEMLFILGYLSDCYELCIEQEIQVETKLCIHSYCSVNEKNCQVEIVLCKFNKILILLGPRFIFFCCLHSFLNSFVVSLVF